MNLVVGNAKPALPHGSDGRCEQAFAAALRPDLSSVHGDSSVLRGCWGFFFPFSIISFIQGGVLPGKNKIPFHYNPCLC